MAILSNEQVTAHVVSKMLQLQYKSVGDSFLKYAEGYNEYRPFGEGDLREQMAYAYRQRCMFNGDTINFPAIRAELATCVPVV